MPTDGQRGARAAFDAACATFERLATTSDPGDLAATLIEAWDETERALRALAGTSALTGKALIHELRGRDLIAIDHAYALVDFQAVAERARAHDYPPTPADVAAANTARAALAAALERDVGARGTHDPVSGPITSPESPRSRAEPTPPPGEVAPSSSGNTLGRVLIVVVLLAVIGGGIGAFVMMRNDEPDDLRRGRAAFAAGDRLTAYNAFSSAASAAPALAEPHIYLGRMARDAGDMASASAALRRAVELEPQNPLAHRELAALLLASGQLDLARSFYQRAIELDPEDRVAMGYMACTLHRLGRPDLALRFSQRAGAGEWGGCLAAPPPPPLPPSGTPAPLPR